MKQRAVKRSAFGLLKELKVFGECNCLIMVGTSGGKASQSRGWGHSTNHRALA